MSWKYAVGKSKLVCPNKGCINKSLVYRNDNSLEEWKCRACGTRLTAFVSLRDKAQNEKAKRDLKQYEA